MTMGQICFAHEYCTDCPVRKECTVRPTFYSDEEYAYWRKTSLEATKKVALLMGFPESCIPFGLDLGIQMMDKRRAKELELFKTYSPT